MPVKQSSKSKPETIGTLNWQRTCARISWVCPLCHQGNESEISDTVHINGHQCGRRYFLWGHVKLSPFSTAVSREIAQLEEPDPRNQDEVSEDEFDHFDDELASALSSADPEDWWEVSK